MSSMENAEDSKPGALLDGLDEQLVAKLASGEQEPVANGITAVRRGTSGIQNFVGNYRTAYL